MKTSRKIEIIRAFLRFDSREQDKTHSMWVKLEQWLIDNHEMKEDSSSVRDEE